MPLRRRLIRLAATDKALRSHLLPLLRREARFGMDDNDLMRLLSATMEGLELAGGGRPRISPAMKQAAQQWTVAVAKVLGPFVQQNKPVNGQTISDLLGAGKAPYVLYRVLLGELDLASVWRPFYDAKTAKELQKYVERAVGRDHARFMDTLMQEAFESAQSF